MSAAASLLLTPKPPLELADVWRGSELARQTHATIPTGHTELDAELPGAGWPQGDLTEILQVQPGLHEWRLLLPALRQIPAPSPIVLVGAPHFPFLPALQASGLDAAQCILVQSRTPAERLWACEQALRCGTLGALLAWLPQARSEQLRRLQLASGATDALVFAMRPDTAVRESSPAPLRIQLQRGSDVGVAVHILKRRGPPLDHPLQLQARLPVVGILRSARQHTLATRDRHAVDRLRRVPHEPLSVPA